MSKYEGGQERIAQKTNPLERVLTGIHENQKQEKERSRVRQLLSRLDKASDIEKVQIYGEIDPKLALGYQIANEKNKIKQQGIQATQDIYKNFGLNGEGTEPPQNAINTAQGTENPPGIQDMPNADTGFSSNGPQTAARNETKLTPSNIEDPAAKATQLRAAAGQVGAFNPSAAQPLLQEANAMEKRAINAKKFQQDVFESERNYNTAQSKPFVTEMQSVKKSIPRSRAALQLSRNAIESGEVGPFSAANLAQITGRPELQSVEGAALNIAQKQNLIGTLGELSARAQNKWLEQVAIRAFPMVGQTQHTNLMAQEAIEGDLALKEARSAVFDELYQQDMLKQGYTGADLEHRVNKAAEPLEKDILDRTAYRSRVIYEDEKGDKGLRKLARAKAPKGTPLTRRMFRVILKDQKDPAKAIERAKQLGYVIYPEDKVKQYAEEQ